jgi:hypothetical protein
MPMTCTPSRMTLLMLISPNVLIVGTAACTSGSARTPLSTSW